MSSLAPIDASHRPATGQLRRGRPPGPQRRPGGCLIANPLPAGESTAWDNLSGREQILVAAAARLDQQIRERITLAQMCRDLHLDAHNLTAAFKQFHGCTMSAYLQQLRVRSLFHGMAAEPQASLASQFRRFGLVPTPSERRLFRRLFGLSIEAHRQNCCHPLSPAGVSGGSPDLAQPSALAEAIETLKALQQARG